MGPESVPEELQRRSLIEWGSTEPSRFFVLKNAGRFEGDPFDRVGGPIPKPAEILRPVSLFRIA
jgi:hypothetical protein